MSNILMSTMNADKYQHHYPRVTLKELQHNQLFRLTDGTMHVYRVLFSKEGKVYAEVHEGTHEGLACALPDFLYCIKLEYKH